MFGLASKSVSDRLQRVLNAAARLISDTRKYDRGLTHLLHIESSSGSTFLSESSINSARPSTDVCRTRHRLIWSPRVHWSLMSPADNTSALPAVISWLFCVTGAPHLAIGPSLFLVLRALWHGMHCLTMSEIWHWDATHFNVSSRHFCSRSTSFPSTLEVFHDYTLNRFTIDIDTDIECRQTSST